MRESKDATFIKIAKIVERRSTCIKKQYGAVIVKDGFILSTGYNGAPSGLPHCTKETCLRLDNKAGIGYENCRAVHAEQNCIIQCARHGTAIDGGDTTIYITGFPCMMCLKIIINAGINRIVYTRDHAPNNKTKLKLLEQSGIEVVKFDE